METLCFRIWDRENRVMISSEDAWVIFVFRKDVAFPEAYHFNRNMQVWKWLRLSGAILAETGLRERSVPCPELLPEPGSTMLVHCNDRYNQDWPSRDQFLAREQPIWGVGDDAGKGSWN